MIDWSEIQVDSRRDRLRQREISRRLGISLVTVRQAMSAQPPQSISELLSQQG